MKENGWILGCAGLMISALLFGERLLTPVLTQPEIPTTFSNVWQSFVDFQFPVLYFLDNTSKMVVASLDPAYETYRASALSGIGLEDEEAILSQEGGEEEFAEVGPILPLPESVPRRGIEYSMDQLSDYDFLLKNFYRVHQSTTITREQLNAVNLLAKDMHLTGTNEKPQILIYHTHGSEYFADTVEGDSSTTIAGMGAYLAQILRDDYGLNVLHDGTVYPYNSAYSDAYSHVTQILQENPSIEVVIDLHRDAAFGRHFVTEIDGKPTATVMFFNGVSQTKDGPIAGRENPYLLDNLAFSLQLKLKADASYPGFVRPTYIKAYRYNMHLMPKTLLIEAGAETNTLEEMKNAMKPLAELLFKVLV